MCDLSFVSDVPEAGLELPLTETVSLALLVSRLPYRPAASVSTLLRRPLLTLMPSRSKAAMYSRSTEAAQPGVILHVETPASFDLGLAVSSYGFFMLPPNQWVKVRASEPRMLEMQWLALHGHQMMNDSGHVGRGPRQGRLQTASQAAE